MLAEALVVLVASIAAACLFVAGALFQAGLAAGAPWGAAAWGGAQPAVLPRRLRLASAASAVVLVLAAVAVLAQAGALGGPAPPMLRAVTWVLAGFLALNTLGNAVSPSRVERFVMGPTAATLCLLCALVAWAS